jgi:hypothetical protein
LISGADPADQITQPAQATDGPDRGILNDADLLGDPQEFDRRSADNAAASAVTAARSRSAWARA